MLKTLKPFALIVSILTFLQLSLLGLSLYLGYPQPLWIGDAMQLIMFYGIIVVLIALLANDANMERCSECGRLIPPGKDISKEKLGHGNIPA